MKKVLKHSLLIVVLLLNCNFVFSQAKNKKFDLSKAPKFWLNKLQSRYDKFTKEDNFLVYHKVSKYADRNTELPVLVQLFKGRLYHFMVFADPSVHKVQMKLGKRGVGHIITDKFYPKRDGEFYSDFTYVCSKTGYYLMTVFQRGGNKKQMTHIAVLQKQRDENRAGEFGYK